MSLVIEYYFSPISPWTYLGHQRLSDLAKTYGSQVRPIPIDLGGKVFPVSGGLPLAKRAPQRQAYRLTELKRFSEHLNVALTVQPKYFPVDGDAAAKLILATEALDGVESAMALAGAVMRAVWAEERNIAEQSELAALLVSLQLPASRLDDAQAQTVQARYEAGSRRAVERGVFGAPTYVIEGEMFWGQDRLDFVQRRLARG